MYKRSLMSLRPRGSGALLEEEELTQVNPPSEIFYSDDDKDFLHQILMLAGLEPDEREALRLIVNKLRLSRAIYEQFIETFLQMTQGYCEDIEALTKLKTQDTWDTSEEEELSKRIALIEEIVGANSWSLYSVREQIDSEYQKVRLARERVSRSYLRLVMHVSQDLSRQSTPSQALDNYQNGSLGLIRAISSYDQQSGHRFATYATWWIKQAVLLHLKETANFVHLPIGTWQAYTWLEQIVKPRILARNGKVTPESLVVESGYSTEQLNVIYGSVKTSQVYSLDYPLTDDSDAALMSVVPDTSHEENSQTSDMKRTIGALLLTLPKEERVVVCFHHGLLEYVPEGDLSVKALEREKLRQKLAARIAGTGTGR